ncbi:MAG TPA: type II toxin-antitoxin system VapC family toxin [Thermoanaerobaculia bacterium]|jgi:hypothetical protein
MKPKVYLETTIVSYLTARLSRDLVLAAHQQLTREWWEIRSRFDLFISELVVREISSGDKDAVARRHTAVQGLDVLALNDESTSLSRILIERGPLPEKALADALHISIAVVSGMDYLLTWNCTHIANATTLGKVEKLCRDAGYDPPTICTPEQLMEA